MFNLPRGVALFRFSKLRSHQLPHALEAWLLSNPRGKGTLHWLGKNVERLGDKGHEGEIVEETRKSERQAELGNLPREETYPGKSRHVILQLCFNKER